MGSFPARMRQPCSGADFMGAYQRRTTPRAEHVLDVCEKASERQQQILDVNGGRSNGKK